MCSAVCATYCIGDKAYDFYLSAQTTVAICFDAVHFCHSSIAPCNPFLVACVDPFLVACVDPFLVACVDPFLVACVDH